MKEAGRKRTPDVVHQTHRDRNFKKISCASLDDTRLSYRAKGLHVYLITRPKDWSYHRCHLERVSTDGAHAVNVAVRELQNAGYLKLSQAHQVSGRFREVHWEISEVSRPDWLSSAEPARGEDPLPALPQAESTVPGNQTITLRTGSTEELNTKEKDNTDRGVTAAQSSLDGSVAEVFGHWQRVLGYEDRELTPKRKKMLEARLREGFTVEQLQQAVDRALNNSFLQGQNSSGQRYDDIVNLFCEPERIQRYLSAREDPRHSMALLPRDGPITGRRLS